MRSNPHCRARAFTLIEVTVSLLTVSVLMLGLSAAVMISSHAIPSAQEAGVADLRVQDALSRFRDDVRAAKTIEYAVSGNKTTITLGFNSTGATGEPGEVVYMYHSGSKAFERDSDIADAERLIRKVDSFAVSATLDGSRTRSIYALVAVDGTVQRFFELFIVTPYKPDYI